MILIWSISFDHGDPVPTQETAWRLRTPSGSSWSTTRIKSIRPLGMRNVCVCACVWKDTWYTCVAYILYIYSLWYICIYIYTCYDIYIYTHVRMLWYIYIYESIKTRVCVCMYMSVTNPFKYPPKVWLCSTKTVRPNSDVAPHLQSSWSSSSSFWSSSSSLSSSSSFWSSSSSSSSSFSSSSSSPSSSSSSSSSSSLHYHIMIIIALKFATPSEQYVDWGDNINYSSMRDQTRHPLSSWGIKICHPLWTICRIKICQPLWTICWLG